MKKFLLILTFSTLLATLVGCGSNPGTVPNDPNNPGENPGQNTDEPGNDDDNKEELPAPKGALQELFASLRNNNFTLSYTDRYASIGVERRQETRYTDYSLESNGDLGFNGYAKNEECVFSYNLEGNEVVSGLPVIDNNKGIMVTDIYDYREGLDEFDYTYLPSEYNAGDIYKYEFGKNTKNDELLISVFLRMTYNPQAIPKSFTLQVVRGQLQINAVTLDYGNGLQDSTRVVAYNIGTTENAAIKKYLDDGLTSKTPLDKRFYYLIAPYLQSNNYKTTLDATGVRNDSGGFNTFKENQYYLENAVIYEDISTENGSITGNIQTPGVVATFSLNELDDEKLTITSTPSNQGTGPYTQLYGEVVTNKFSDLEFSNFIGYIDEEHEDSYYITDSYVQAILGYICYFELDSTTRSLRNLRLEVNDWDKHEFTLHFNAYNPTSNLDLGTFTASFTSVDEVVVPAVTNYLDIGESSKNQSIDDLKTVLEKFKDHNYSMDVISGSELAKVYYTKNYYFLQAYGNKSLNSGFIKEGDSIYKFTLSYDASNTNITGINVDRSKDYATLGMTLPGCGTYYGDENTDLFYFSAFDDAIYNYDNYVQTSILGFDYWMNTTTYEEGNPLINFSNAVLKYFYPRDTSGALPQGAGFMVRNGDTQYTTRVSLLLTYSSSDGENYGGEISTFYDIGDTRFEYLENYILENS